MSDSVEIAGVGMHPFGRFPDRTLKDLARAAILEAANDAGVGLGEIDAVYSANAMAGLLQGQEQIRGQTVLRDVGLEGVSVVNVENACASGSSAVQQAALAVRAGAARTALVVGFEKMFVGDLERSLAALESAADLEVVEGIGLQFTAVYAMRVRKALEAGLFEPRHLYEAAVKSHWNGTLNPYAQHRNAVTREEVRDSRPIAEPLTLLMCSSMCDGGAAVILAAGGSPDRRPSVRLRAGISVSGVARSDDEPSVATTCAQRAYEVGGVGPEDMDVVEVHDAMAPAELLYYEQLGFCEPGEAGSALERGETSLGGARPVNPSGGLCSRGHATGATGIAQIAELVWQLRGAAGERQVGEPRLALAQNSGGWYDGESAVCNVTILERASPWN